VPIGRCYTSVCVVQSLLLRIRFICLVCNSPDTSYVITSYRVARRYAPRRSQRIYVCTQTDPQSARLWWLGLGAALLAGLGGTDRRTDESRHRLMPPNINNLHCVSKKQDTKLLPITSLNVNRFSKFFHWQTHW